MKFIVEIYKFDDEEEFNSEEEADDRAEYLQRVMGSICKIRREEV